MSQSSKLSLWNGICFVLVFLTGVTALVFQNTWHRYLTYLLGSQSQATAIIISVFLGGMSVGYFIYGRLTQRFRSSLYKLYGVTEFGIGVWALFSPNIYRWLVDVPISGFFSEIGAALLFFGVPTVLMGGTLPVLTQALSLDVSQATRTHSRIYGFNTFGAALGSLLAGFYFLPTFGLPLSLVFTGLVNIVVGIFFFLAGIRVATLGESSAGEPAQAERVAPPPTQHWLWIIAFISGFVTIGLETLMVRLFILSAGAFTYAFSVIVSIFVFCIAMGGYWVGRLRTIPADGLLILLLCTAFSLLGLYRTVESWPYYIHLLRTFFSANPQTFGVFYSALYLAGALVLMIPISLCGATLPLCFHFVKRSREDLGAETGNLYAVNTVGCVLGALIPGYYLLYRMNLNEVFLLLIVLVAVSLLVALVKLRSKLGFRMKAVYVSISILLVISLASQRLWDNQYFARGLFNLQGIMPQSFQGYRAMVLEKIWSGDRLQYYRDGPAATVSLLLGNNKRLDKPALAVQVDGKTDGSTFWDFYTMQLLGHLPALMAGQLKDACVIGFGTGMTAGVIAQYAEMKHIDLIEINPMVLDAGKSFAPYNYRVLSDPKVNIVNTDAFRFFRSGEKKYDLIVSEPSNPWMAGVENLFTQEFYELASRRLNQRGVFMQWFHGYYLSEESLRLILSTFASVFPHVHAFQVYATDYALMGSLEPFDQATLRNMQSRFEREKNNLALADLGFVNIEQFLVLERAGQPSIDRFVTGAAIHTLENPKLSYRAGRDFFTNAMAHLRLMNKEGFMETLDESLLELWERNADRKGVVIKFPDDYCNASGDFCQALALRRYLADPDSAQSQAYLKQQPVEDREVLAILLAEPFIPPRDVKEAKLMAEKVRRHALKFYTPNGLINLSRHRRILDSFKTILLVDRLKSSANANDGSLIMKR